MTSAITVINSQCPKSRGGKLSHHWFQITERPKAIEHECSVCGTHVKIIDAKPGTTAPPRPVAEPERQSTRTPTNVDDLVAALKVATNPVDKRKLRAALRKAGHKGGLR